MIELLAAVVYPDAFIRMSAVEEYGYIPVAIERNVWDDLADCESGDWIDGGVDFVQDSARWDWASPETALPPWGTTIHHGGLQFHPDTWSWVAPMVGLGHIRFAYEATREEQILVAEKVLDLQGWQAWPICGQKIGLRR